MLGGGEGKRLVNSISYCVWRYSIKSIWVWTFFFPRIRGNTPKKNLKFQTPKLRKLGSEVGWFGVVYLVDQSHLMTEATAVPFLCRSSVY